MATPNANAEGSGKALFAQVQFYIECSKYLDVNEAEQVGSVTPAPVLYTYNSLFSLRIFWKRMALSNIPLPPMIEFLRLKSPISSLPHQTFPITREQSMH